MSVDAFSPESTKTLRDVLLNDVTGELFEEIVQRPIAASKMPILSKADRIAITLDGSVLLDRNRRDVAVYQAEELARAIVENGGLRPEVLVDVVVTKLDLIKQESTDLAWVKRAAEDVAKAVEASKRGNVLLTCARSQFPKLVKSGRGVDKLFSLWVGERPEPRLGAIREPRQSRRVAQ